MYQSTNSTRTLFEVVQFARDLGMRPSELVHRLCDNSYIPSMRLENEPAGTGGGVEPVRDIFKVDPENLNLEWGPDFEAAGCVIGTHRLVDSGEVGIQFCEEPETMTPAEARQVAAALLVAADYLDRS